MGAKPAPPVRESPMPWRTNTQLAGVAEGNHQALSMAPDGAMLKAWWFPSATPANCVLVLHGIGDSRTGGAGFAPMLLAAGYSVLVPDLRAHGESGGEF